MLPFGVTLEPDTGWQWEKYHHHQDFCSLLLMLKGRGTVLVERQLLAFSPSSLMVIPASAFHLVHPQPSTPYLRYLLEIPLTTLRQCSSPGTQMQPLFQHPRLLPLEPAQCQLLRELWQQCGQPDNPDFGDELRRQAAFLQLLLHVCQCIRSSQQTPATSLPAASQRLAPILSYIQTHLAQPLRLDQLARELFINKYHLCHLFQQELGISPGAYIVNCRISRAQQLLRSGMSVQQAAEQSGFATYSHFIRTFTHIVGLSPGRYARQQAGDVTHR